MSKFYGDFEAKDKVMIFRFAYNVKTSKGDLYSI